MTDTNTSRRRRYWFAVVAVGVVAVLLLGLISTYWTAVWQGLGRPPLSPAGQIQPSAFALQDIPPMYLALYEAAGEAFGVPWPVLAGIGKVESDHGRSTLPGVHSGSNFAGAEGPMQFLPSTFAAYAVDADRNGHPTPYSPADAIYTAAHYLARLGASLGAAVDAIRQAIYGYNRLWSYVDEVLSWAEKYTGSAVNPSLGVFQRLAQVIADVTRTALAGLVIAWGPPYSPVFAGVPLGGLVRSGVPGNCTWWASYNVFVPRRLMGDGAAWIATYQVLGYRVVQYEQPSNGWPTGVAMPPSARPAPGVGSIVSWDRGLSGSHGAGHVAVVIASDASSRTFEVSEMNWRGLGIVDQRTVSVADANLLGFVPGDQVALAAEHPVD